MTSAMFVEVMNAEPIIEPTRSAPGSCRSQASTLDVNSMGQGLSRGSVLAQAAAFTFLNPHVYLDAVLLVGSIGAQQPAPLQGWFAAGASTASLLWFSALGFGARWLAPWFAKPRAWQVLDALIGVTMWVLSALLVRHVWAGLSNQIK